MRTDENLSRSFRGSKSWKVDVVTGKEDPSLDRRVQEGGFESEAGQFLTHSHSGNERNHLFLSNGGKSFADISGISGLDTDRDSRGFALLDFDRDGWQDIVLVNANSPLMNLFHNRMREIGDSESVSSGGMIAIRFVGGNDAADRSREYSARDGYGARVTIKIGETTLVRDHHCGEGFAVQNSATMIVGIGSHERIDELHVRWPSGKTSSTNNVDEGTLLTVYESPLEPSDAFDSQPYRKSIRVAQLNRSAQRPVIQFQKLSESSARLRLYTTMATWCVACVDQYPQLTALESAFAGDLELFAVPVDPEDTPDKLRQHAKNHDSPYEILYDASSQDRDVVRRIIEAYMQEPPLPSTLATDADGRVINAWRGVPSVSELAKLLHELP